jgi:hypothetical protein
MPHKKQGPNGWPSQPTPPGRLPPRADRPAPPPPAHARCCLPVPLPLPLLKWPDHHQTHPITPQSIPPKTAASTTIMALHRRRSFPSTVWSLPSPSAPIKGTPAAPHLAAPHTALFSSSLALELVPTVRLYRRHFATVARPYKSHPGRASSHRTPHRPLFLLSCAGAHPHYAPSSPPFCHYRPAASPLPRLQ